MEVHTTNSDKFQKLLRYIIARYMTVWVLKLKLTGRKVNNAWIEIHSVSDDPL